MSTGDSAVASRSRLQAVPGADSPELHSESIEGGCVGGSGCCPAWESQWVGSEGGAVLAGSRCGGAPTPEHVGVSCCEVRAPQLSSPPCPRWGRQCRAGRERVGFEGAWDPHGGDHGYLLQFQSIRRLPLVPGGPRKVLRGRPAPPQPWVTEDG